MTLKYLQRVWDGRDDNIKTVPAGVYFLKLQAAGSTLTRKVVLTK